MTSVDAGSLDTGWERLARILDAVFGVEGDLSLPTVLRRVVEAARLLVRARYGALGVLDDDGHLVEFVVDGMDTAEIAAIDHYPEGLGILGLLIVEPRPLRLRDLTTHPASYGFPPGHPPMRSFLGVPIRLHDQVFGNLYLCEKEGAGEFTADDEVLTTALANTAGIAIENARLHQRLQSLALVGDRERIARDLHDKVIQRLFAAGMTLQATARVVGEDAGRRLERVVDELDETIREIRTTIFALGSRPAGTGSVRADVLGLVGELAPVLGFDPDVHFDGPVDTAIPPEVADEVLTCLRELLTNVGRHASATRVDVVLRVDGHAVLRVVDDGIGPGGLDDATGHGLANLRARAHRLGGDFVIAPSAPRGTVAEWRVPLPA